MKLNLIYFLALIIKIVNCNEYLTKYSGYSVFKVIPNNHHDIKLIQDFKKHYSSYLDLWTDIYKPNRSIDIMVSPLIKDMFLNTLEKTNIKVSTMIEDVSEKIKLQRPSIKNDKDSFDYGKYHTLDEIHAWIDTLSQTYPQYVSIFNITQSFEGRLLKAFKISVPSNKTKPAMWFDGGIHAREWISPATVIYIAYSLLNGYGKDANVTEILNSFDFYILPVFNVDGYVYTFTNDRLWRKTRSVNRGSTCRGCDPNRNWDSHWCEQGSSSNPCDDTYCGSKPFSEVEVRAVADFLGKNNDTIKCYINFHSYSQLWMTPYGYSTKHPKDYDLQDQGSALAVNALYSLYKTEYEHGDIAETIYVASGGSVDWTYDTANIIFSYAVELRDQGQSGFLLPESEIIPSGLETFEAIKALAFYIKSKL